MQSSRTRFAVAVVAASLIGLGVVACGGGATTTVTDHQTTTVFLPGTSSGAATASNTSTTTSTTPTGSSAGSGGLDFKMGDFNFDPAEATVASGSVKVTVDNVGATPHEWVLAKTDLDASQLPTSSSGDVNEDKLDNNPPAHPRSLSLAGGESWHRVDDFDISWVDPDQGPASPIGGAYWRIVGPSGYDTGVQYASGRGIAALSDRKLPRPGLYSFRIWLRDEAGNSDSGTAIELPLRLDDVPPGVAFEPVDEQTADELPHAVSAEVHDEDSGPAAGTISYRRVNAESWSELPTRMEDGASGGKRLVAPVPDDLEPGTYVFRAEASDGAGNSAATTRLTDGTEMALRKLPPPVAPNRPASSEQGQQGGRDRPGSPAGPAPAPAKAKTRLFAKLRWRHRRGQRVTVPFGAGAALSGRLLNADGAGLAGRRLRVVSRPSHGALMRRRVATVRTGRHGGFRLALPAGPSRRLTVVYRGEPGLARARRPALALRVRGAATLSAAPRSLRTGQSLRLWGRVRARGAPLPRRGKLVAIQYYENEARVWRPVLVTRSDHSGRFHARYRFRYISGTARIRLRAVALAEERWPYAPGASRPVLVRVSG